jgi:acetyl esterase/lipase
MPLRMRFGKALAFSSVLLASTLGVGSWLLLGETNVDRDEADYRSRMYPIWSGPAPGSPDPDPVARDFDSGFLRHWFINELESRVPYLVAFPVVGAARAPALLLLPGGGYSFRSEKLDGLDIARWFSERGIAAFVLNYRVDPFRYPVPLRDAERAVRWLRANASVQHIDPRRIAVMGSSAGGHLAALLATQDGSGDPASADVVERHGSKPDLLILSQAVISTHHHVHEGSIRRLLGNSPAPELLRAVSAENRVTGDTPPTFIWTTKTDEMVDYENSELFAQALAAHGIDHELHLFPEGPHGRGLSRAEPYAREWPNLCLAWLARHGFTPERSAPIRADRRP